MKNLNCYPYQAYKPYTTSSPVQTYQPFFHQHLHSYQSTAGNPTQASNYPPYPAVVTSANRSTNLRTMSTTTITANQYHQNPYNFNATSNYCGHMPFVSNHQHYNQPNHQQQQQQQQQHQQQLQLSQIHSTYEENRPQHDNPNQQQPQTTQHQQQPQQQRQAADQATPPQTNGGDKFTMDAREIANFLANELFMHQLVSVDGIQSGVPTLTTSTLTPTTLRSIEESFYELTSEPINAPSYQAGFIPPPLASFPTSSNATIAATYNESIQDFDVNDSGTEDSQGSWNATHLNENSMATTDTSSGATDSTSFQNGFNGMGNNSLATSNNSSTNDFTAVNIAIVAAAAANAAKNGGISNHNNNNNTSHCATKTTTTTTRRNQGGRRPNKSTNTTPEEEEKRRIRRERNKLAAARCRKRRVDQTNELLEQVAVLEKKREGLQKEIESFNSTKQELEYILEAHRPTCQKIRHDLLTVNTINGLIVPTASTNNAGALTGMDTSLASIAGRSNSPLDLKPVLNTNMFEVHIKNEPLDGALDSNSSLDYDESDGPPSPKRMLRTSRNPMIPPPLPNVATLTASLAAAAASASLNTPIVSAAPVSFGSLISNNATLNTLNALNKPPNGSRQRPNSLPSIRRISAHPQTDINGVAIQTPSTGMFNFDSLMDGGTGLTPVSGPLMPTCSSLQNKHPLELTTPTSEPSKLVSL